jgi:hypothetical protein
MFRLKAILLFQLKDLSLSGSENSFLKIIGFLAGTILEKIYLKP